MPRDGTLPARGPRALDLLNFFVADVQTGFGPFVAVYLTTHKWTQIQIGFALTVGTVVSLISQLPAGALVDAARNKRVAAGGALLGVITAALLLAIWPTELPVIIAQSLHAVASCVLTPAIAAISLHLVGHAALGERLGRNARFASIGNGLAAAAMGGTGAYLSSRAVFLLTAALCVPALLSLLAIGRGPHARRQTTSQPFDWQSLRQLFTDRRLLIFAACVLLFHLSNAAMLPLIGGAITMRSGDFANMIIAACIVVPQGVVALCSPWVGRSAASMGRRPVLLLGWAALPLRAVLLAVLPGAWLPIGAQAISGISAAVFGVMFPLLAADITRGTSHFNLCMGALGLAMFLGAGLSTTLGGWIADAFGVPLAFIVLAFIGLLGTLVVWLAMPETRRE
ncbi:MAG TPA: MFS transporter [Acetobacteraceae bacterium]|jgi:MFS family permease|nr:MFS transporter [Acetobacteraceae bacterium]